MWMDVADPGPLGDCGDVALDGASVECPAVVSFDQVSGAGRSTHHLVVDDEIDQHRQQGYVAVVVQLADGDPELADVSETHHGVVFECRELPDAHPGPGQQLDHE